MLDYDDDTHTYFLDGLRVPSVSEVMRHFIPTFYPPNVGCELGKAVHKATALHDNFSLNWDPLDKEVKKRVMAYHEFKNMFKWESVFSEQALCMNFPEGNMRLAGRFDRIGLSINNDSSYCLCDIKVSDGEIKGTEIQTAMYALLWRSSWPTICDSKAYKDVTTRIAVYLRSDGKFKLSRDLKIFSDDYDYEAAANMVSLYNWMLNKKYIKED